MRKVIFILSSVGLLASLFASSCIIKEDKGDGGSAGKGDGGGGNSIFTGGTSGISPDAGGATGNVGGSGPNSTEPPCEGLLEQLGASSDTVCSQSNQSAKFTNINMLIVLDKSGSMSSTPAGYQKSKWAGAIDALKKSLDPADPLISYGIALYPAVDGGTCDVADGAGAINVGIGPASDTVGQINDLMAATTPGGGTPTAAALAAAYDYYTKGDGIGLEGTKYVLLVTDGGPNCNSDIRCGTETCTAFLDKSPAQSSCWDGGVANCCDESSSVPGGPFPPSLCLDDGAVVAQLDALRSAGINTFVIGIPGSEAYATYLDGFAEAGGQPIVDGARKYYEVTGESGLADAFKTITTSLVGSCTVPLNERPQDKNKINVAIDCSPLPKSTGDQVNWTYDEENQSIIIEGPKCEQIQNVGVKRIDVVNGCPVFVVQ